MKSQNFGVPFWWIISIKVQKWMQKWVNIIILTVRNDMDLCSFLKTYDFQYVQIHYILIDRASNVKKKSI